MKVLTMLQGSEAWERARLGLPTASGFKRILTPGRLQMSEQRHKYRNQLLAEWLTGESMDTEFVTPAMERGSELEGRARAWYQLERDLPVQQVGFCLLDNEKVGCSPDGLVGDEGGLEIKCPMAPTFVSYLLGGQPEEDHKLQVQGALYITGRKWWDVLVWNPYLDTFPPMITRVERDERVINVLALALDVFLGELDEAKAKLLERGCVPAGGVR